MRPSTVLLVLAAACAVVVPAAVAAQAAQPPPATQADAAATDAQQALSQVVVRGTPRHHRLDPSEAKQIGGTYAMSNGWTVHVTPRMRHVYLSINDGAPIEMFAQTADKFASADGNVATVFNLGPWQDDVIMSYVPDSRLSDVRVVVGSGSLVAR